MSANLKEEQERANTNPLWVNEKAAANMTGISVHTLRAYRLHRKGLPYSKVGRSVRYSTDDIRAYMTASRIDPTM